MRPPALGTAASRAGGVVRRWRRALLALWGAYVLLWLAAVNGAAWSPPDAALLVASALGAILQLGAVVPALGGYLRG